MNTLVKTSLATAVVMVLAACGGKEDKTDTSATASAGAQGNPDVQVAVNDKACEPMELTVPAGKTTFIIKNNSSKALEWEILKGVMVVDERENIAPTLTQKLTVNLAPGEYDITCGLLSNPKGKLVVTENKDFKADAHVADMAALEQPLTQYKTYVQGQVKDLVARTEVFVGAIKAGDKAKAKSIYAYTRQPYERIEPIAELFSDLDTAIDVRADDFKDQEKDPEFTGFHRLEYALFAQNDLTGMDKMADKLLADVKELQTRIDALAFPANKVVGGAAALIEEVAMSKISGEEERYSHTDLDDFDANVAGAKEILNLFRKNLVEKDEALVATVDANFKTVDGILNKYRKGNGFETYDKLSEADKTALKAPINTLAEELAKFRGVLGLD